jgi:hypothetical protein
MRVVAPAFLLLVLTVSAGALSAQVRPEMQGEVHSSLDVSSNSSIFAALMDPVSGEPYEARKITSSVWRLADGTTITHESASQIARDAEGRIREELVMTDAASVGAKQLNITAQSITIGDPVDHSMLLWTGANPKIAMRMALPQLTSRVPRLSGIAGALAAAPPPVRPGSLGDAKPARDADPTREQVHTEDLGKQSLAGMLVTGKRTTTVIPTGKIGNDRPITIVHEEWYSPDLKIVVKSTDSDPRSGDRSMTLEGLTRGDPAPALFKAPEGVKVTDMGEMLKALGNIGRTPAAVQ